jgi:hypothetical protein
MMNFFTPSNLFSSPFFYILVLADLLLRGLALYKSARKDQRVWFVALLIINSMGLLPLIYLLVNKEIVFPATAKAAPAKKSSRRGKK